MKKILLAFDRQKISDDMMQYILHLNNAQPIAAIGMFLPTVEMVEVPYSFGGVPAGPLYVAESEENNESLLNAEIRKFTDFCTANNIEYKVHNDFTHQVIAKIVDESRFADLLVLDNAAFYANLGAETQNDYISELLHKLECPCFMIPGVYEVPKNIIMAYDGSEQSIYALKQFSYMFPEYSKTQVLLVYFNQSKEGVPHREEMEELMSYHYFNVSIFKLKIDPAKDLDQWVRDNGASMFVAGAYSRSFFSELFHKSFVNEIVKEHKIPVFVSHK